MTLAEVLEWLKEQDHDTLTAVADDLIDRGFAADPDGVEEAAYFDDANSIADLDEGALEEALSYLRRRDYPEALHWIARALGRDFDSIENMPLVPVGAA